MMSSLSSRYGVKNWSVLYLLGMQSFVYNEIPVCRSSRRGFEMWKNVLFVKNVLSWKIPFLSMKLRTIFMGVLLGRKKFTLTCRNVIALKCVNCV
jgi:hypothetical protein